MRRLGFALLATLLLAAPAAAAPTAATAPTKVTRVGGVDVAYRSVGEGRPLVLIMGLSGAMDAWPPSFVDALAAAGHRVVLLDNQGVGRSTAQPGALTIRRMADTTAGLVRKLGLRRPDVAGWSMGGMIAQSLLVRHPGMFRRAALLSTAPGDGGYTAPAPEAVASLAGNPAGLLGLLFGSGAGPSAVADYAADIGSRQGFAPQASDAVRARQLTASSFWLGGRDPDGKAIGQLRLPVLVAGGKEDRILPVGNQIHIATTIARASYVDYPRAAHGFFIQEADRFLPRLVGFLR
ncbi:MAG: alpha/beta fold hydrolase [Solirubrobacteraceae bacterium]